MKIIALAGLAKAGKTAAADAIASELFTAGYRPIVARFASPLKEAAVQMGFYKGGDTDHLYRWFCQTVGERAREEHPDWFVAHMSRLISTQANLEARDLGEIKSGQISGTGWHERVIIIDDTRYPNELRMLKENSAKVIFISAMRRLPDMDAEWRQHHSEDMATEYEKGSLNDETFDFSVSNNDPCGEAKFLTTIQALSLKLVSAATEEGR